MSIQGFYHSYYFDNAAFGNTGYLATNTVIPKVIDVHRFGIIVTTAFTTDLQLQLRVRPTAGSATGEITLQTITMVTASRAQGSVLFSDLTPYRVVPGNELTFFISASGASGVATVFFNFISRDLHKRDTSTSYYSRLFDSNPAVG